MADLSYLNVSSNSTLSVELSEIEGDSLQSIEQLNEVSISPNTSVTNISSSIHETHLGCSISTEGC